MEEQSRGFGDLHGLLRQLDAKLDARIDRLDQRIDALDQKVDRMFHSLDLEISRQFLWLAGFQLTTLLAIIGFLRR